MYLEGTRICFEILRTSTIFGFADGWFGRTLREALLHLFSLMVDIKSLIKKGSYEVLVFMFGSQDSLPLHGGSQRNNGISKMPVVNKSVAMSLLWVIVSLLAFLFGIRHCRNNGFSYRLECTETQCTYTSFNRVPLQTITFPKSDLLDADMARVNDNGEYLDAEQMRKQKSNRAGYTIRFKARLPVEEGSRIKSEQALLFAPVDMSRRVARNGVTSITKYIHATASLDSDKNSDSNYNRFKTINVHHGKTITAIGAITAFLSIVSMVAAFSFGTWSEETRRVRLKKAS